MIRNRFSLIMFICLLTQFCFSCGKGSGDSGQPPSSWVGQGPRLPAIFLPEGTPFWDNPHIVLDKQLMAQIGADYCAESEIEGNALDFFAGYLPLLSADQFCDQVFTKEQMQGYLGNMYISGFYGGVWLRDVLFNNPKEAEETEINTVLQMPAGEAVAEDDSGTAPSVFTGFTDTAGAAVDLSLAGSAEEVRDANFFFIIPGLYIYGYDYGYYYYLIDHPLKGLPPVQDPLICNEFMDCQMVKYELKTLTQYKPVLEQLFTPASPEWTGMNMAMNFFGKGSVAIGDLAWNAIMGRSAMFDNAYEQLIDLSARFMLVSELTLLPTMKGYADSDEAAGRCGLLQEAGMITWLGSYVQGLASDLPEGTFPEITCP